MLKLLPTIILAALFCLLVIDVKAQRIKVVVTSIKDVDNKLVVKYDLLKSDSSQSFNIILKIASSSGNSISAMSLSGDIGDKITGGLNKKIIWDYNSDRIVLQDNISIEIFANLTTGKGSNTGETSLTKAMILSTLFPGLGISKIDHGKPYWLMGVAAYASISTSYYLNKKSNDTYSNYLNNTKDNLNDELLNKSQNQNKLSKTMAYTALGFWGVNLGWTLIKASRSKHRSFSLLNQQNIDFYTGYNPFTKSTQFTFKLNF